MSRASKKRQRQLQLRKQLDLARDKILGTDSCYGCRHQYALDICSKGDFKPIAHVELTVCALDKRKLHVHTRDSIVVGPQYPNGKCIRYNRPRSGGLISLFQYFPREKKLQRDFWNMSYTDVSESNVVNTHVAVLAKSGVLDTYSPKD